jgi:hypothetical protein
LRQALDAKLAQEVTQSDFVDRHNFDEIWRELRQY